LTGRLERNTGAMIDARRETGTRALAAMERAVKAAPFLVDDEATIADIAVYAYSHRAEDCGFDLGAFPAVTAWIERVARLIGQGHPVRPYGSEAMLPKQAQPTAVAPA
jgi:glutathione S-transferase